MDSFKMGGKWLYSCCFVGFCFQNLFKTKCIILAQSAGAIEYTDNISAEGKDTPNKYPGYDMTLNGVAPLMLEFSGMQSTSFIAITPRPTLHQSGST